MDDLAQLEWDAMVNPARPDVRVGFGMATAEFAAGMVARSTAEQMAATRAVLDDARRHPGVFVDDVWGSETVEFAVRAAVADLAVRLAMSEAAVRDAAHRAELLLTRTPRVWAAFREGDISVPNARTTADLAGSLPDDRPELWTAFDQAVAGPAAGLAPGRFATRARVLRDRVHTQPLVERNRRARECRRTVLERDLDGMSWYSIYGPAETLELVHARVDAIADDLAASPAETRTRDQLRADIALDFLQGTDHPTATKVTVAVTVPVFTLMGLSEQPGTLEGYGPIDADTARRLAAHVPSFTRILTDPITSVILDIDRTTRRIPAGMRKWLQIRDGGCVFPGCGQPARRCDIDHRIPWEHGGTTADHNLAHLCRHHHRLKHESKWTLEITDEGRLRWTSPTGHTHDVDPPPF